MKHLRALTVIAAGALMAAACSSNPTSTPQTSSSAVAASVNGTSWAATTVQATWQNNVLGIGGVQIQGGSSHQINITGLVSGTGTFQLNPFAGLNATYSEGTTSSVKLFSVTSGTLKVDRLSSSGAAGSFSFEAKDSQSGTETRSITNGTFDVKF